MADLFYARCSTKEQNEARQIEYARELDIEERYIFIDKASGKNTDRPALKELLRTMRNGDTLHITELARLGRSTKDLIDLMDKFEKEGVEVHSKKEAIDTSTPAGRLVFHIFASVAEFQRQLILENAAEGRAAAKAAGKPTGRPKVDQSVLEHALYLFEHDSDKSIAQICAKTGISRSTLYRAADEKGAARAAR
ncbi:recombinase family protein [Slackia piriformis]|uniref:recombinase family protein n=1 Tax=Slackia piriformis TaxID=626934 RepID=UPI0023F05DEB|nr:recombinase family protein [Slackia piriformis]